MNLKKGFYRLTWVISIVVSVIWGMSGFYRKDDPYRIEKFFKLPSEFTILSRPSPHSIKQIFQIRDNIADNTVTFQWNFSTPPTYADFNQVLVETRSIKEIRNFREKYPEYNDLGDLDLAQRLAKKFPKYSTWPDKVKNETLKQADKLKEITKERSAKLRLARIIGILIGAGIGFAVVWCLHFISLGITRIIKFIMAGFRV